MGDDRNGEYPPMPEHSETTPMRYTQGLTLNFTLPDTMPDGTRIVAAYAENRLRPNGTWIVTMTTPRGSHVDSPARVTQDATP